MFVPVAIETTGVFGPETPAFLRELGRRLQQVSADENSYGYLIQCLSVAVQRGNSAAVLGSAGFPLSWKYEDPGSPFSREYGDPLVKMGTPSMTDG